MITHLLSSTFVSLIAVGAVLMLRHDRAAVRHAILFVAIVRFAIPTSWLDISVIPPIEPMLLHPGPVTSVITRAASTPAPTRFDWRIVWAFGALASLSHWSRRTFCRPRAVRPPTAEETQAFPGVPLRIVAPGHVPGACGIFRQHVVLPDGLSDHLTPSEMNAVIAHEMAHVRRKDNLTAAISHLVVSVFWFHPLLWWLERRMLAERETACDEAVVGQGIAAPEYCAGIAKVCRLSFAAAGYAGANGSNLQKRMEHIMSAQFTLTSSRFLRTAAGVFLAAALVIPLVRAQSTPAEKDERLARANELVRNGQFDQAIEIFRGMLAAGGMDKQLADLHLRMGETYRRMRNTTEAIASLEKARQLDPENLNVVQTLALTVDYAGRREDAIKLYREVLAVNPNQGIALNNLAYALAESPGGLEEAMLLVRKAQVQLPDSDEVYDTVGWVYLKGGKTREAVNVFADVVLQSPGNVSFRGHLATALEQAGENPELVALLRTAPSAETEGKLKELVRNLPR